MRRNSDEEGAAILISVEWEGGRGILDNVIQKKTEKMHGTLGTK